MASRTEQLLRLLVCYPVLAEKLSVEQRALLDGPEMAPVVELIATIADCGATTPAMLFEATRDSQYATLYQDAAGEMLTASVEDETAQADLAGVFRRLELERVETEFKRLTANGVRNEYYQQLTRRLAELKGATNAGAGA
jgi:hypothetical protein